VSRSDDWNWYAPAPKQPPPKHGIKLKRSGTTWWGQRWIEALERMSRGYSHRLARGRNYARAGRTHDLIVQAGRATAKVTGSRTTPYTVTISLAQLGDATWDRVISAMAEKAQFSAALLGGAMPQDIDHAFKDAGTSLFPAKLTELVTECSCPDWANPCKHVAATHYVLGEAFDRDPFLLFELRGRSRAQVLDALRRARTAGPAAERPARKRAQRRARPSVEVHTVVLGKLAASDYDCVPGPLPALHLNFEADPIAGAMLHQLGKPVGWSRDASPEEILGPMIRRAADKARNLAMAEVEPAAAGQANAVGPQSERAVAQQRRRKRG
jgi:uncharacterized Zn finger protein